MYMQQCHVHVPLFLYCVHLCCIVILMLYVRVCCVIQLFLFAFCRLYRTRENRTNCQLCVACFDCMHIQWGINLIEQKHSTVMLPVLNSGNSNDHYKDCVSKVAAAAVKNLGLMSTEWKWGWLCESSLQMGQILRSTVNADSSLFDSQCLKFTVRAYGN